jgi:uncharacterized coiled-coil DUF342 family protein
MVREPPLEEIARMTNDEFERLKESLRAQRSPADDIDPEKAAADAKLADERRKLDRDMDRIERVLKKMIEAPWPRPTPSEADRRLAKALAELAERRSKHSLADKRLNALNDIVRPERDGPSS